MSQYILILAKFVERLIYEYNNANLAQLVWFANVYFTCLLLMKFVQ